jgi:hypothetical protein
MACVRSQCASHELNYNKQSLEIPILPQEGGRPGQNTFNTGNSFLNPLASLTNNVFFTGCYSLSNLPGQLIYSLHKTSDSDDPKHVHLLKMDSYKGVII